MIGRGLFTANPITNLGGNSRMPDPGSSSRHGRVATRARTHGSQRHSVLASYVVVRPRVRDKRCRRQRTGKNFLDTAGQRMVCWLADQMWWMVYDIVLKKPIPPSLCRRWLAFSCRSSHACGIADAAALAAFGTQCATLDKSTSGFSCFGGFISTSIS